MKEAVLNNEPDWDKLPTKKVKGKDGKSINEPLYSEKTIDFIKLFLTKDWKSRPLIKDVFEELKEHANSLFKTAKVKWLKFPDHITSWDEISQNLIPQTF